MINKRILPHEPAPARPSLSCSLAQRQRGPWRRTSYYFASVMKEEEEEEAGRGREREGEREREGGWERREGGRPRPAAGTHARRGYLHTHAHNTHLFM